MRSRFLLICALSCLAFASCEKQDDQVEVKDNGMILPISDTYVHPLGDTFTVSYTSVTDWELLTEGDELESSKQKGGAGTTQITFTVGPNIDGTDNKTVLTFKSGGKNQSFKVWQKAVVFDVDIREAAEDDYKTANDNSVTFSWLKSTGNKGAEFTLTSNIEWGVTIENNDRYELKDDDGVIKPTRNGGAVLMDKNPDEYDFSLSAVANNLGKSHNDYKISITPRKVGTDGKEVQLDADVLALKKEIAIKQEYLIFYLDGVTGLSQKDSYAMEESFSELGLNYLEKFSGNEKPDIYPGEQEFDIVFEKDKVSFADDAWKDGEVSVFGKTLFVVGEDKEEAFKDDPTRICVRRTMRLTVPDPNPERYFEGQAAYTPRSLTLPLNVGGEIVATISLDYTQNKYVLDMEAVDELEFGNSDTRDVVKKIRVTTKGPWKLAKAGTEDAEWLDVIKSGAGDAELDVTVNEQNLLLDPKEATLTLSTAFEKDLLVADDDKLNVSQKEFLFELTPDKDYPKESIERLNTIRSHTYSQKLVSSGDWTLKMVPGDADHGLWVDVVAVDKDGLEVKLEKDSDTLEGGPGEWTISVGANDANPHKVERTMNMTVTSDLHAGNDRYPGYKDGLPKPFILTQKQYRFELAANGSEQAPDGVVTVPAYKSTANQYRFKVQCGAPWRITAYPEWVKSVSPADGDGTEEKVVTVTFEDNIEKNWNSPRNEDIIIRSDKKALTLEEADFDDPDGESKQFNVIQEAFVFNVTPGSSAGVIGAVDGNSYGLCDVECTAEAAWEIQTEDWVNVQKENVGTKTVAYTLANNALLEQRSSTVKIVCNLIGKTVTLDNIVQGAYKWAVDNKSSYSFAELPGRDNGGKFNLTCLGPWTASVDYGSGDSGWIEISDSGSGSSDPVPFGFTVADNVSTSQRSAKVTVKSKVGTHSTTFTVYQNDYQWNVTGVPSSETLNPLDTKTYALTVQCSGKWEVKSSDNGFIKVPTYTNGGRDAKTSLSFEVVKNYSDKTLNSTVTIQSKDNSSLKKEFTVIQNPYEFGSSGAPEGGKVDILGGTYKVDVTCSGTWAVESLDTDTRKFVESATRSSDGRSLEIKVKPNYDPQKAYTGSVKIKTTDIPADSAPRTETIALSQDKYLWDMTSVQSKYEISAAAVTDKELCTGLKSTGELVVASSKSWVRCKIKDGKLIITADENTDTKNAREANITIKSEHYDKNNALKKELKISQKAAEKKN